MPFSPKLSYVAREIRKIEVAHQIDAEQTGCTYGYVGIAGEIAVYLECEEYCSKEERHAVLVGIVCPNFIYCNSAIICHYHLLEESPKYLAASIHCLCIIELAWYIELW